MFCPACVLPAPGFPGFAELSIPQRLSLLHCWEWERGAGKSSRLCWLPSLCANLGPLRPCSLLALCCSQAPLRTTEGLLWPLEKQHSSGLSLLSSVHFIDPFSFWSNTRYDRLRASSGPGPCQAPSTTLILSASQGEIAPACSPRGSGFRANKEPSSGPNRSYNSLRHGRHVHMRVSRPFCKVHRGVSRRRKWLRLGS